MPLRPGRFVVLSAAVAALALGGCGHMKNAFARKEPKQDLSYQERPVELLYATGAKKLDERSWKEATQYFDEVERQHPYSEWARRAVLMEAYASYEADNYEDAVAAADRFISLYPGNPSAAYAYYLKAQCWFEQINDVGRDQATTEQALASLSEVQRRFPTTEYALDAKLKTDLVYDQLAGKEMTVGRYYLRQGQPVAAMGRFKTVIDRYQTTSHTPEALYRLVEANLTLGLSEEAKRDGAVLGFNFPGDPWYGQAYKLLTAKGLRPQESPAPARGRKLNHKLFGLPRITNRG